MWQQPIVLSKGTFMDARGFFQEVTKEGDDVFNALGIVRQINMSKSVKGTLRGIHAQKGMAKAMWVPFGMAQIVAVNLDVESEDFGKTVSHHMRAGDGKIFYAPDSWGRGFLALEEGTVVAYACSDIYRPQFEYGVHPLTCGVNWDVESLEEVDLLISDKDRDAKEMKGLRR